MDVAKQTVSKSKVKLTFFKSDLSGVLFFSVCFCMDIMCKYFRNAEHEFVWDANSVERRDRKSIILSHCKKQATFHPGFSDGTIIVRGDKPFEANKLCYWEVKMMTTVYGTDVVSVYLITKLNAPMKKKWRYEIRHVYSSVSVTLIVEMK